MLRLLRRIPDGAIAAAVVVAVLALQLPFRHHWVNLTDEGAILQDATDILAGRRMYVDAIHPAFPGVFYLTALVFAVAGATFDTARTFACVIFALTCGAVWTIGRWWLRPLGALALVVLFVDYRVWAYPHWHMLSYSSLAVALLLAAAAALGRAFAQGRAGGYAGAGMVAALAMVTKQDSGVIGTAALGLAILVAAPEPPRRRIGAALYFVAGATATFASALVALAFAGMLPALVRHTIIAPLHGFAQFAYQGSPPLWPPFTQDPDLRARAYSYFPSILFDLYWPRVVATRLFRETAWPDLAMRLAYHLPWIVPLVALPLVASGAAADPAARLRRARERLVVLLAVAAWVAFNRPHDWIHLLVLYPPALLVLSLVLARATGGPARVPVGALVGLALVGATVVSARVALDLRRTMASPVTTPRGTLYATAPQAASLQDLVDGVALAAPPGVPLASLPYHPLVNFITARPPLTRYYSVWPAEPPAGRTETVERDLDARPDGLVVYNQSQVPMFPRLGEYAPDLFAYLADNYRIVQALGGEPFGYEFLLLKREPPPFGRSLLAGLGAARVTIASADAGVRDATAAERERLVGTAVWPFRRVLRVGAEPGATVAVRLPVTPGRRTRVFTSYGMNPDAWSRVPPVRARFQVAVGAGGTDTVVADAELAPFAVRADRRWFDVDVDLGGWAGTSVEVVLMVTSPMGAPAFPDRTGFGEPRVVE
jgi:hypothetical protein